MAGFFLWDQLKVSNLGYTVALDASASARLRRLRLAAG
jgi:hypothetical protein